ncbi:MAG: hypothetical protein HYZ28_01535 [Myxococcales bacterium]|nr:hypothetical protein [Myxococcales bacterium]
MENDGPQLIRDEIARARDQIATSAEALRRHMASSTDWREWVRRRPGLFLAGAFALGFLIGSRR